MVFSTSADAGAARALGGAARASRQSTNPHHELHQQRLDV